jgi:hypothetical protein
MLESHDSCVHAGPVSAVGAVRDAVMHLSRSLTAARYAVACDQFRKSGGLDCTGTSYHDRPDQTVFYRCVRTRVAVNPRRLRAWAGEERYKKGQLIRILLSHFFNGVP